MEAPCKDKPRLGEAENIKCSKRRATQVLSHRVLETTLVLSLIYSNETQVRDLGRVRSEKSFSCT